MASKRVRSFASRPTYRRPGPSATTFSVGAATSTLDDASCRSIVPAVARTWIGDSQPCALRGTRSRERPGGARRHDERLDPRRDLGKPLREAGHGGRIVVDSQLDRGSNFRVYLPVRAHEGSGE